MEDELDEFFSNPECGISDIKGAKSDTLSSFLENSPK
jgi:hypothetical protein